MAGLFRGDGMQDEAHDARAAQPALPRFVAPQARAAAGTTPADSRRAVLTRR